MLQQDRPKTPAEMYEQFYVPAIFRPLSRLTLEAARLRPGEALVDLACGTGIVAREAAPLLGDSGTVLAVDLRPGMLEVARSLPAPSGARIEWRQGDALSLDVPDASFDVVLCQQGLQFFADRGAAVREMKRVTKRGGRIVIAAWQSLDRHELFDAMMKVEAKYLADLGFSLEDAAAPFSLGSAEELRALCEQASLPVEVAATSIEVSFVAEGFVENMEYAYSAVMPQFAENPAAFGEFVEKVNRDTEELRKRYRQGDRIVFTMHTHIATARLA